PWLGEDYLWVEEDNLNYLVGVCEIDRRFRFEDRFSFLIDIDQAHSQGRLATPIRESDVDPEWAVGAGESGCPYCRVRPQDEGFPRGRVSVDAVADNHGDGTGPLLLNLFFCHPCLQQQVPPRQPRPATGGRRVTLRCSSEAACRGQQRSGA